MPTIEKLLWQIDANTEGLRRELKRGDKAVAKSEKRVNFFLTKMDKGFARAGIASKKFAIGLAAAVSVRGLRGIVADVASLGDTADKLGITAERLQELRFAAEQNGVAINVLDMAWQRFTRRLGEAQQGGGELLGTLQQYGIALTDSNGAMRGAYEVLGDYADAIAAAGSKQEQLRLAFKGFDSEGAALVTLLRKGKTGLAEYASEARELGVVIDNELVAKTQRFDEELKRLVASGLTKGKVAILELIDATREFFNTPNQDYAFGKALDESREKVIRLREELDALNDKGGRPAQRGRSQLRIQIRVEEAKDAALELKRVLESTAVVQEKLETLSQGRRQKTRYQPGKAARKELAELEAQAVRLQKILSDVKAPKDTQDTTTPVDFRDVEQRAKEIERIEERLQDRLFDLRHDGAERITADFQQMVAELDALAGKGVGVDQIERAKELAAAVRDAQLGKIAEDQTEAIAKSFEALRLQNSELEIMIDATARGEEAVLQATAALELEGQVRSYINEMRALGVVLTDEQIAAYSREVAANQTLQGTLETINERQSEMASMAASVESSFSDAFGSIIFGAESAKDAIGQLLLEMAKAIIQQQIIQPLAQYAGSGLANLFSFADGGVMTSAGKAPLRSYASGGVAHTPQLALFGEGSGAEAFVPLPDGEHIPVTMTGGGGFSQSNTIVVNGGTSQGQGFDPETLRKMGEQVSKMMRSSHNQNDERNARGGGMRNRML